MTKHVFISYCTPDLAVAKQVCRHLENDGLACWMAPRDVPMGRSHASVIPSAIKSCPIFLLLLSKAALASADVGREVHLAAEFKVEILPFHLDSLGTVDETHPFRYLLTGLQYVDASARVQPQLGRLRERIRELLVERKVPFERKDRSRFKEWLATFGAWGLVVLFEGLMLEWLHRTWFNLASFGEVVLLASQSPAAWLLLAAAPLAALGAQLWLHRDLKRLASLDALFAIGGDRAARARLGAALALFAVPAAGIGFAVPSVTLYLVETALEPSSNYERFGNSDCPADAGYVRQTATHYRADLRTGSGNPQDTYTLQVQMTPYATKDGLEFCDVWLDKSFGTAARDLVFDDPKSSAAVQVRGSLEWFTGTRSAVFTVKYYEGNLPSPTATIRPTLTRGLVQKEDHDKVTLPLR